MNLKKKSKSISGSTLNFFQNAAKLTFTFNILLPLISVGIASTQNSPALLICLGEGYKNYFFTAEIKMCNYNNPIWNNACKLFFVLQAILISNLIDVYCTYFISKMINSQTEAAKSLIGENTYISRKKYVDHTYRKVASTNASRFVARLVYMYTQNYNFLIRSSSRL